MSDDRKNYLWPWIVALLIGLPVLYALSSGPSRTIACETFTTSQPSYTSTGDRQMLHGVDYGTWWPKIYAPLLWASRQPWGGTINSYWGLFRIPYAGERP